MDTNFNFSFSFNDLNQLVFSTSTLLGSLSIDTAISINPSVAGSVGQNLITVNYSDPFKNAASLQASISTISVMKDLIDINRYSIVLHGNIFTLPNTTLYIIIPFINTAKNNNTPNSVAIEQIVKSAYAQIIERDPTTRLKSNLTLNNLITSSATYSYTMANKFTNKVKYNDTFFIYKDEVGMISNSYKELFELFNKSVSNKLVYDNDTFITNIFTPLIESAPTSSEIMIDCSPLEITTEGGNVMFSKKDTLFGNFSNDPNNNAILTTIKFFLIFVIFVLIVRQVLSMLDAWFVQPKLFEDGNK